MASFVISIAEKAPGRKPKRNLLSLLWSQGGEKKELGDKWLTHPVISLGADKSDLEARDQIENITQMFPTGIDAYSWPRSGKVHPHRF